LHEAATVFAYFRFSDDRHLLPTEGVKVDIVATAAKTAGAARRIALRVDAERL
jgi:hypothetical protein